MRPWRDGELEYERYIGRFNICTWGAPQETALCPPLSRERWERERKAEVEQQVSAFGALMERNPSLFVIEPGSLVGDFPPYYGSK